MSANNGVTFSGGYQILYRLLVQDDEGLANFLR